MHKGKIQKTCFNVYLISNTSFIVLLSIVNFHDAEVFDCDKNHVNILFHFCWAAHKPSLCWERTTETMTTLSSWGWDKALDGAHSILEFIWSSIRNNMVLRKRFTALDAPFSPLSTSPSIHSKLVAIKLREEKVSLSFLLCSAVGQFFSEWVNFGHQLVFFSLSATM